MQFGKRYCLVKSHSPIRSSAVCGRTESARSRLVSVYMVIRMPFANDCRSSVRAIEALIFRFKKSNIPFDVSSNSVLIKTFFERNPYQKIKNCNYCNQKYLVNLLGSLIK